VAQGRTLAELSRLVGAAPQACLTGAGIQTCSWRLDPRDEGYALFAAAAQRSGPLALRCDLPLDGAPRAPRSCWVEGLAR
jgi:hypothetical protein